ncbi:MAG: hypothetical protein KDA37_17160 [Planctomycetales bacterium]|nr:hypothetical protein [Planctomycetales bacterium]
MDLRRVAILLPGEGLGEFPTDLHERDAAQALHAWTAAWRPELIAAAGRLPGVCSTAALPDEVDAAGAILILPEFARSEPVDRWRQDLGESEGSRTLVIDSFGSREEVIASAQESNFELTSCDGHWSSEFYALGYAYLQTELLTQGLVFPSVINGEDLEAAIVAAARAAVARNDAQVEKQLRTVYDLLEQVREHVYPVETSLLDIVLLGETTIGQRLEREVALPTPKSFVMSPDTAEMLVATRKAGELAQACLLATHARGAHLARASPGVLQESVQQSLSAVADAFGKPAAAFVLTEPELPVRLPDVLDAASTPLVGVPLSPGPVVRCDQPRFVWREPARFDLETLITTPRDAASAHTLLRHAKRLGESLYRDHISTEVFVAWAGERHELFEDLRTVAHRSGLLGRFQTVEEYFHQTEGAAPDGQVRDEELGPQAAEAGGDGSPTLSDSICQRNVAGVSSCALDLLAKQCDEQTEGCEAPGRLEQVAATLQRDGAVEGKLVCNPLSMQRVVLLADGAADSPCDLLASPLVPSVPGLGYRVFGGQPPKPLTANDAHRATQGELRNELMDLAIDPRTGGVQSLKTHSSRRNRLALRPVARRGKTLIDVPLEYKCDPSEVIANASDRGIVRTRAVLSDLRGGEVARCTLQYALLAQWNRVFVDVEFDASSADTKLDELNYAIRIALPEGAHRAHRSVQWARLPEHRQQFIVSDYLQLSEARSSVTLGSGTLLRCLRHGPRMVDLLIPSSDERGGRCRLVLALDEAHPLRVALDAAAQLLPCNLASCRASESGAWTAHIDSPNVQVVSLAPLEGSQQGVRLSVLETAGRTTDARARFARRPQAAWLVDFRGERSGVLDTVGEAVVLPLGANQWRTFEVTW